MAVGGVLTLIGYERKLLNLFNRVRAVLVLLMEFY